MVHLRALHHLRKIPSRALWRRFLRRREGSTAIEFGLVGLPFFIMLFGIIETAVMNFGSAELEHGVQEVTRKIRTGSVQSQKMTRDEFKNLLCKEIESLLSCNHLEIDVRTFNGFDTLTFTDPLKNGDLAGNFQFDPGGPGQVVLARAFYKWQIVTPIIGTFLSNMSGGQRLLQASAAFRNEPFTSAAAPGGAG